MAKDPLKGMSMERVRVEEFENQRYKVVDESILFSLGFLSRTSLHFMGIRIFIVVCVRNAKS